MNDPFFGNVLQCGNTETMAKDIVRLEDVDYGSSGAFTINFWVRNPTGSDFPDREREQLFGHGDPDDADCGGTMCPHNIHVQLENSGDARTMVTDSDDDAGSPCGASDTDGTKGILFDDEEWRMLTITTKADGSKGHSTYYDAAVGSGIPDVISGTVGVNSKGCTDNVTKSGEYNGGDPINPVGLIRLCGRQKGGGVFDAERYFNGQLAHFSVYSSAMSADDVKKLFDAYKSNFPQADTTAAPTEAADKVDDDIEQSDARSGAMMAACLWLTSFWF